MKTRICPYCDSPMKKMHRCDVCRSFVWKPTILDIHYKQNTTNKDCAYALDHDPLYNGTVINNKTVQKDVKPTKIKKNFNGHGKVKIIATIIVVIVSLWECISENVGDVRVRETVPEAVVVNDAFEPIYTYLDESDMISYNEACDQEHHMPILSDDLNANIETFMIDHGLSFVYERNFSGYVLESAYFNNATYEYAHNYFMDDDYNEYVSVYSDAVTSQIHSINALFKYSDVGVDFLSMIANDCLGFDMNPNEFIALFVEDDNESFSTFYDQYRFQVFYSEYNDAWDINISYDKYPYDYATGVLNYIDLTDEEVLELGTSCNAVKHMNGLYGEKSIDIVEAWLNDHSIHIDRFGQFCTNTQSTYQQADSRIWTENFLEKYYSWYNNDYEFEITIMADSYSDEIHGINIYGLNEDQMEAGVTLICEITSMNVDPYILTSSILSRISNDGYAIIEIEQYSIYASESEFGYLLQLAPY